MGGMLAQPITSKESKQGEGLGLRYGVSTMQGWRFEMEDAHDIKIGLNYGLDDWSYFAVFDGHAGKRAAAFAALNLLEYILRDNQFQLATESCPQYVRREPELSDEEDESWYNRLGKNNDKTDDTTERCKRSQLEPSGHSESASKPESSKSIQDNQETTNTEIPTKDEQPNTTKDKPKFCTFPVTEQLQMAKDAIRSGFMNIDQSMRENSLDMSGCTAVCAFVSPTHLFIANCGDSRAVLFDGKRPSFATEDHKPYNPKERKRIIDAGGSATQRINNTLAVSRALGDFDFKKDKKRGVCEQLVSPEPEITVIERQPSDEFLIIACDGIWDVVYNDELCEYVQYKLKLEPNLENICSSVIDACFSKGSRDNMSIIIIVFENAPKFDETNLEKEKIIDELIREAAESLDVKLVHDFNDFRYQVSTKFDASELAPGFGILDKNELLRPIYERKVAENHAKEKKINKENKQTENPTNDQ